jgi:purine-binding chemotaxis protein CheW
MNLRGEILTLIDISHFLQLKGDQSPAENATIRNQQAVVVRIDKLVAGVTVDTVHDVVYLHSSDISPVPAAVHAMNEDFIRGVASYQDKQMSILDLSKILSSENLVVNESV